MVKKIELKNASLILEKDNSISVMVKDRSLPNGFKTRIKDSQNYAEAYQQFQKKYPELRDTSQQLPRRVVLPQISHPEGTVTLGVTYNDVPMTFNFYAFMPHLMITGQPGSGKTCLALAIAHDLISSNQRSQVTVITDYEQEYASLQSLDPYRRQNKVLNAREVFARNDFEGINTVLSEPQPDKDNHVLIVDSNLAQYPEAIKASLERVIRMGRSLRIYLVLVQQQHGLDNPSVLSLMNPIVMTGEYPGRALLRGTTEFQVGIPTIY